jgi:hypothetical protein
MFQNSDEVTLPTASNCSMFCAVAVSIFIEDFPDHFGEPRQHLVSLTDV